MLSYDTSVAEVTFSINPYLLAIGIIFLIVAIVLIILRATAKRKNVL